MSDTEFHRKHEDLTEIIYNSSDMLPSRYVFVVTNRCNLRCGFCFQDKKPKANAMSSDDWINVAKQLPDYARITLTGGEPLILPNFEKIFAFIAERFCCNVITNGLLLTKEKINYLLSFPKFKVLSISIDNIGNLIRGVKKDDWENLKSNLRYFVEVKDKSVILDIKTMVLDENAHELFNIYKYLVEEIGVDTHVFQFLKGSPIQHADHMFNIQDALKKSKAYVYKNFEIIKEQLEQVRVYNVKNKRDSFLHPKIGSITEDKISPTINYFNEESHLKSRYNSCRFPWSSIHINFDGIVFPCLAISIGDIRKTSLYEIIYGEKSKEFRKIIKKENSIEACNRCGWLKLKQ